MTQSYQPNYDKDVFVDGPAAPGPGSIASIPIMAVNFPYALSPRSINDLVTLAQTQFPDYAVEGVMAPAYALGSTMSFSRNVPMLQFTSKKTGAVVVLNAGEYSSSFFGVFGLWTNNGEIQVDNPTDVYGVKYPDYAYALSEFTAAVQAQLPA